MSGETASQESGWTVDTLKEYVDQRFVAQEKDVRIANVANEKRFDAVNEFRGQLNDQVNTFLPRKEYDARHETLENRVSELNDRLNRSEGQAKGSDITMGKFIAVVGISITVMTFVVSLVVLIANGVF